MLNVTTYLYRHVFIMISLFFLGGGFSGDFAPDAFTVIVDDQQYKIKLKYGQINDLKSDDFGKLKAQTWMFCFL